jgi:redox-sensitive bicupin YhaK (pirin superfamily)
MTDGTVLQTVALGQQWQTIDPFLFGVHHRDDYPRANEFLGPDAPLHARDIGMDFSGQDGWSMYHGSVVPGFPQHPHRGFETVTIVRRGLIDHSDSLGAAARFGGGDVQWLTAGAGVVHSEMFPLLDREGPNPLELFQIWLNLPAADKVADPYFTMLWREDIPVVETGTGASVTVVAGALDGHRPPAPPPDSWASRPEADLAIWVVSLDAGGEWDLPAPSNT